MNTVNILEDHFICRLLSVRSKLNLEDILQPYEADVFSASIQGCLKRYPDDFEVIEVARETNEVELTKQSKPTEGQASATDLTLIPPRDLNSVTLEDVLAANDLEILGNMNTWFSIFIVKKEIDREALTDILYQQTLDELCLFTHRLKASQISVEDKATRRQLHLLIVEKYPFLRTESNRPLQSHSNSSGSFSASNHTDRSNQDMDIVVSPDPSFVSLTTFGLNVSDIEALYLFRSKGPLVKKDDMAGSSYLQLTSEIDTTQRPQFFEYFRQHFPHFTCRTVHNSQFGRKFIEIQWNTKGVKNFSRKVKAVHRINEVLSPIEATPEYIHIGFRLLKYNVEHSEAMKRLADILGCSIYDISYAGTKDRRAKTYQSCCLSIKIESTSQQQSSSSLRIIVHQVIQNLMKFSFPVYLYRKRKLWADTPRPNSSTNDDCYDDLSQSTVAYDDKESSNCDAYLQIDQIVPRSSAILKGSHDGNRFIIILRELSLSLALDSTEPTISSKHTAVSSIILEKIVMYRMNLLNLIGFPNYFGSQRMGLTKDQSKTCTWMCRDVKIHSLYPHGVYIGKLLIFKKYREAVDTIILGYDRVTAEAIYGQDHEKMIQDKSYPSLHRARYLYIKGEALDIVYHTLPSNAFREREVIESLRRHQSSSHKISHSSSQKEDCKEQQDHDKRNLSCYEFTIQDISYHIRSLWISSYQSWLWNQVVSHRLTRHELTVLNGDLILQIDHHISDGKQNIVSISKEEKNSQPVSRIVRFVGVEEVSIHQREGHDLDLSSIVLPLFGNHILFPQNETGRYYFELLKTEGIIAHDVVYSDQLTSFPFQEGLSCPKGNYRSILKKTKECEMKVLEDTLTADQINIQISFSLPAGSFATAYLRELLQNNEII